MRAWGQCKSPNESRHATGKVASFTTDNHQKCISFQESTATGAPASEGKDDLGKHVTETLPRALLEQETKLISVSVTVEAKTSHYRAESKKGMGKGATGVGGQ